MPANVCAREILKGLCGNVPSTEAQNVYGYLGKYLVYNSLTQGSCHLVST